MKKVAFAFPAFSTDRALLNCDNSPSSKVSVTNPDANGDGGGMSVKL